jgi:hypothetical protein
LSEYRCVDEIGQLMRIFHSEYQSAVSFSFELDDDGLFRPDDVPE